MEYSKMRRASSVSQLPGIVSFWQQYKKLYLENEGVFSVLEF